MAFFFNLFPPITLLLISVIPILGRTPFPLFRERGARKNKLPVEENGRRDGELWETGRRRAGRLYFLRVVVPPRVMHNALTRDAILYYPRLVRARVCTC